MLREVSTHCGRCSKHITQGYEIRWGNNHYVCETCKPQCVADAQQRANSAREQATFWDGQAAYQESRPLVKNL